MTSPEEAARHLERLLANPDPGATPPQRALLQYLVEQTLADLSGRINVYTVAAGVSGRGPDYNPQVDPITRIR